MLCVGFYSALAKEVTASSGRFAEGIFYVQGILCSVGGSSVCRAEAGGARSSEAGIAPGPIPGPLSASRSPALHLLLESALPFLPLEREGIL